MNVSDDARKGARTEIAHGAKSDKYEILERIAESMIWICDAAAHTAAIAATPLLELSCSGGLLQHTA